MISPLWDYPSIIQLVKQHRAGGIGFSDYDYAYSARGNLVSIGETQGVPRSRTYTYDELERLTNVAASAPGGAARPSDDEDYGLDPEGNRLTSHLSLGHVTSDANRLSEDDRFTYAYDVNGNLISKTAKLVPLSNWDYAYDALDQLISVSRDGLVVEAYAYDALGRRSVIATAGANDIGIVNDGPDRYLDLNDNGTGGGLVSRYVHGGQIDEPLELERFDGAGALVGRFTYHRDHLGSVRFLTDETGTIANEYDYDSYGNQFANIETVSQPSR